MQRSSDPVCPLTAHPVLRPCAKSMLMKSVWAPILRACWVFTCVTACCATEKILVPRHSSMTSPASLKKPPTAVDRSSRRRPPSCWRSEGIRAKPASSLQSGFLPSTGMPPSVLAPSSGRATDNGPCSITKTSFGSTRLLVKPWVSRRRLLSLSNAFSFTSPPPTSVSRVVPYLLRQLFRPRLSRGASGGQSKRVSLRTRWAPFPRVFPKLKRMFGFSTMIFFILVMTAITAPWWRIRLRSSQTSVSPCCGSMPTYGRRWRFSAAHSTRAMLPTPVGFSSTKGTYAALAPGLSTRSPAGKP